MKHLYGNALAWLNQLSLRERVLLIVMSLVLVFIVWDVVIWLPLQQQGYTIKQKIHKIKQQVDNYRQQTVQTTTSSQLSIKNDRAAEYNNLLRKSSEIDAKLINFEKRAINSTSLSKTMKRLLTQYPNVELIRFETTHQDQAADLVAFADKIMPFATDEQSMLLELKGQYLAILDYLQGIEDLNWQIFWDHLDYKVENYPEARVIIKLHTLNVSAQ